MGLLGALVLMFAGIVQASDDGGFSTSPSTKDGKRYRIAYYEGGPDDNYYFYLEATIRGLMGLGWIETQPLPPEGNRDPKNLWDFLTREATSKHLEFLPDGFYSSQWDKGERAGNRARLLERLNERKDVDLLIAMGTWAGKDLASDEHSTPTIVMSTSDPVESGIIRSVDDSGFNHVHARVDPQRFERQIRVFHDIINFASIGVAYEQSTNGRIYAAVDDIERVARERGFKMVQCFTTSDVADLALAAKSVRNCFHELAKKGVDAIYVTQQGGVSVETIPGLVAIANDYRLPTFYQAGSDGVRRGFLLSISRGGGFTPAGRFLAATVAKVLNGAKPRELKQLFEDSPNIAINLKTAEVIGLYLYADVLAAADELYRDIQEP